MVKESTYTLYKQGEFLISGDPAALREKIETLLEEKVGVFVSLQECTDEDYDYSDDSEYAVYLHTDNDEELSEEILTRLNDDYGLNTYDPDNADFVIKGLLGIEIVREMSK